MKKNCWNIVKNQQAVARQNLRSRRRVGTCCPRSLIGYLYYGSGHLHQISFDGEVISDIERDKLHREIQRTQGSIIRLYDYDPMGRSSEILAYRLERHTNTSRQTKPAWPAAPSTASKNTMAVNTPTTHWTTWSTASCLMAKTNITKRNLPVGTPIKIRIL